MVYHEFHIVVNTDWNVENQLILGVFNGQDDLKTMTMGYPHKTIEIPNPNNIGYDSPGFVLLGTIRHATYVSEAESILGKGRILKIPVSFNDRGGGYDEFEDAEVKYGEGRGAAGVPNNSPYVFITTQEEARQLCRHFSQMQDKPRGYIGAVFVSEIRVNRLWKLLVPGKICESKFVKPSQCVIV